MNNRVYLALGSNIGDRVTYLRSAVKALNREPGMHVIRCSSVYETKPVGYVEQPLFLNAVIAVETGLEPEELLDVIQKIELSHERQRHIRWGPRTLDIDILLYENMIIQNERLIIPHPRLVERAFVLLPLNEIAPHAIVPKTGMTVAELAERVEGKEGVIRVFNVSIDGHN